MTKTRGVQCRGCNEIRWIDPQQPDPGCECGFEIAPDNQLRVTGYFKKPITMYSVGMSPDEIPAFKKALPLIDTTPDGVPIARSRHQKKQILRHFGFQENK